MQYYRLSQYSAYLSPVYRLVVKSSYRFIFRRICFRHGKKPGHDNHTAYLFIVRKSLQYSKSSRVSKTVSYYESLFICPIQRFSRLFNPRFILWRCAWLQCRNYNFYFFIIQLPRKPRIPIIIRRSKCSVQNDYFHTLSPLSACITFKPLFDMSKSCTSSVCFVILIFLIVKLLPISPVNVNVLMTITPSHTNSLTLSLLNHLPSCPSSVVKSVVHPNVLRSSIKLCMKTLLMFSPMTAGMTIISFPYSMIFSPDLIDELNGAYVIRLASESMTNLLALFISTASLILDRRSLSLEWCLKNMMLPFLSISSKSMPNLLAVALRFSIGSSMVT